MAAKPTPGSSSGTWGQDLNDFLDVGHESGGANKNIYPVNGVDTQVYTKYLTGTLSAGTSVNVAHSVTGGTAKILYVSASIEAGGTFYTQEYRYSESATNVFVISFDNTNVIFSQLGTTFQGADYKIKIEYIV